MSVLALVTKTEEIRPVVTWATEFAVTLDTTLIVMCWSYAPNLPDQLPTSKTASADALVTEVRRFTAQTSDENRPKCQCLKSENIQVRHLMQPDATTAILEQIRLENPTFLIAAAQDQTGKTGATYETNPLLRQSPCNTVILFGDCKPSSRERHIVVGAVDNPNEETALLLAARMVETCESQVTLAWLEEDVGEQAIEVGRRELKQLIRNAGVNRNVPLRRRVFSSNDTPEIVDFMDKQDLVLVGANNQPLVQQLVEATKNPTIAVIKRSPPLRSAGSKKRGAFWKPRLSPADYADLVQGLRHGSRLSVDYLAMLGLSAAIATLGLLQDSAAVVIGSMLLSPLMTPMIGSGLALAQANPKLGKRSLQSIFYGFLFTLVVSFILALTTPGKEMTLQVLARGDPNLLDLLIALFSAAAASYALARPSLVGAVAGVAIATALVPPLCSVGISIAYQHYLNAQGAALLFMTNLVAIILGASATFRLMGVTSAGAGRGQRRWVYWTVGVLGATVIAIAFPLGRALERTIEQGKPQPSSYPLTKKVEEALIEYVGKTPDVEIVATGRPSTLHDKADVVIFLATPHPLLESYAEELVEIVHREMGDEGLVVEVHCLQEAWQKSSSYFWDEKGTDN